MKYTDAGNLIEFYKSEMGYNGEGVVFSENKKGGFNVEYCYVIFNHSTGLYKIGMTKDLCSRLAVIRTSAGCEVKLITAIELELGRDESARSVEKALHRFFKYKRRIGEWFNLDLYDISEIETLFAGVIGGIEIESNFDEHAEDMGFDITRLPGYIE